MVDFKTTLFALIRESLGIKVRSGDNTREDMEQNDVELRQNIRYLWPKEAPKLINRLVPTKQGK